MNSEVFEKARTIKGEIKTLTEKLFLVEKLMNCCVLKAEVSGTPKGSFHTAKGYIFTSDMIKEMLPSEQKRLITEINNLEDQFKKL